METFWSSSKFKAQQREWYELLKKTGFKDAESDENLKQASMNTYRHLKRAQREAKLDYYLLITQGLNDFGCDDKIDTLIMEMLAEGFLVKEVSEVIKERFGKRYHRETIRYTRRKYEHRWNVRKWDEKKRVKNPPKKTQ